MITVEAMNRLEGGETLFIDGKWQAGSRGGTFPVDNPATGEVLANLGDAGAEDTRLAIDAAHRAFREWSRTTAAERGAILRRSAALMRERSDELARQLTSEQGKPVWEAAGEIEYAAGFLDWFAAEAERTYGDVIPAVKPGKRHFVINQPVGVVGAITPWNFPAAMVTRKVGPALAAGCTVVLKPAEQTPLTALSLMEIFSQAGLPDGVLNLVTSNTPEAVGGELLGDRRVRKITFTGSTEVGKLLMRQAADQVKRLSLELGGHAPVIVFADANLDVAVRELLKVKFRNGGQTCLCPNRVYVHEDVFDDFQERLVRAVEKVRVGDGLREEVDMGPLIDDATYRKVKEHLDDAVERGAQVLCGGNGAFASGAGGPGKGGTDRGGTAGGGTAGGGTGGGGTAEGGTGKGGRFFRPTVLSKVDETMRMMHEETFGPIIPLTTFTSERDVYERANDSDYGLAAYVFTESLNRAIRAGETLEYGIVGVNEAMPASYSAVPFGGFKESGIGREGGHHGLQEFMEVKLLGIGLDEELD